MEMPILDPEISGRQSLQKNAYKNTSENAYENASGDSSPESAPVRVCLYTALNIIYLLSQTVTFLGR